MGVMKLKLLALMLVTLNCQAQLAVLPPPSVADGVEVQNIGLNAGASNWENPAGLMAYQIASDANYLTTHLGAPDNVLGLNWGPLLPASIQSHLSSIDQNGGTIRVIFLGESAGWLNDFGYTRNILPQNEGSFTVFENIQAVNPSNIQFGQYFDVGFLPSDNVFDFDIWLNGVGSMGEDNQGGLFSGVGGVYTAFRPENSDPFLDAGNVKWSQSSLFVNTWIDSLNNGLGGFSSTSTYLVGFEDWRLNQSADQDFNDFVVAVQFFREDGTPFTPVPEPSTYALLGSLSLAGLCLIRKIKK